MKYDLKFFRVLVTTCAVSLLFTWSTGQTVEPSQTPPAEISEKSATPEKPAPQRIKIATFNIQNLGKSKLAKPAVVEELVAIIRKYDVVAVQEIDDRTLQTPEAFLGRINSVAGPTYAVVASPLTGTTANKDQDEQYAFYFNMEKIELLDSAMLYPDPEDLFIREPFAVQFKPKTSGESFVLLTIHTDATKAGATREIAALAPAARWAAERYAGELGVIALGDFNAGVTYLTVSQVTEIRNKHLPYRWIVPDDADTTNSSQKDQAHDRLVVIGPDLDARYTGTWGVDRTVSSKTVSDHLPVWAEFWFSRKSD
jgi:endonuclease/exonuclease/phosphatase family metal-dependent hydrolase